MRLDARIALAHDEGVPLLAGMLSLREPPTLVAMGTLAQVDHWRCAEKDLELPNHGSFLFFRGNM